MRHAILILIIFFLSPSANAQLKTYSFETAEALCKESPKPYVVFIHTSWCKYCKMMVESTFKNAEVISLLNDNFYFIMLDAESRRDISFNGQVFKFKPNGNNSGIHELAVQLKMIDNVAAYPSLTFLAPDYSALFQKGSYTDSATLVSILSKIKKAD